MSTGKSVFGVALLPPANLPCAAAPYFRARQAVFELRGAAQHFKYRLPAQLTFTPIVQCNTVNILLISFDMQIAEITIC